MHWQDTYDRVGAESVSWYQREPLMSLRLLEAAGLAPDRSVIDVGGGASVLVDRLLAVGVLDVTVLDIASHALDIARDRLGDAAAGVTWITGDLLTWTPPRQYDMWHDRAVFHFLTSPVDRDRYRDLLDAGLAPGGSLVIGTFADDGPERCSGLPVARYSTAELAAEFPGFTVERTEREEHTTPGGGVQPFSWLVLTRSR
jgi:trans-aconitate methyltransferase